jgi:UDP-N-acetylglucosamine:LPS N-acetylglucosamine transferase
MRQPVTALTSLDVPSPHPFAGTLTLPRDDDGARVADPTAHGALHWVPHHDDGLSDRMALIARWIELTRPAAVVVDVSVEVALFVRLMGVPVVVMAVPGDRTDAPHTFLHRLADHIVAAWPRELYEPSWLYEHADKVSYVGGISRFAGRGHPQPGTRTSAGTVLVLGGSGGSDVDQAAVDACAAEQPCIDWRTMGLAGGPAVRDPWPDICAADVVVTHAGQGCIADVAAAQRPAIVLAQPRPFGEQAATADALCRHRLAVVIRRWPDAPAWPDLIAQARASDPGRWAAWQTANAAQRAARAIEDTARRCAKVGMP